MNEKYSAFISEVSEILGLGKPVDILKLCMITDRFFKPYQKRIAELEKQIEKMKRHCNCKHRDSEGYCEVKRTYLIDLSYDGCDKWELED